ncbi:MAG: hypothetical protein KAT56_09240 [Sedimentisphaerales bacterium]|nr:hypothetical protein [Sedimentisphaerales bacterium]
MEYVYNLQNRLERVTTTIGSQVEVVKYVYNDAGIRVQKIEDPDGVPVVTAYLVDSYGETGGQSPGFCLTVPVELYNFPGYAKISPNSCTCTAEVGICAR